VYTGQCVSMYTYKHTCIYTRTQTFRQMHQMANEVGHEAGKQHPTGMHSARCPLTPPRPASLVYMCMFIHISVHKCTQVIVAFMYICIKHLFSSTTSIDGIEKGKGLAQCPLTVSGSEAWTRTFCTLNASTILVTIIIKIIFCLIYNLSHHRMFTNKVWTDDSKLNLTAGRHITSYGRLRVKDLPKVPTCTWRLEWDSNQQPSAPNTTTKPPRPGTASQLRIVSLFSFLISFFLLLRNSSYW